MIARAIWHTEPGKIQILDETLISNPEDLFIRTKYSLISIGTERIVSLGEIPKENYESMKVPGMGGDFPFPVKYGYSTVGITEAGLRIFCMHPHQDHFYVHPDQIIFLPENVSDEIACLFPMVETAWTAIQDAELTSGTVIGIVGCGLLGSLLAHILLQMKYDVYVHDILESKKEYLIWSGCKDLENISHLEQLTLFHTTATASGLNYCIQQARFETRIIECSFYGKLPVTINLGGKFHMLRLQIISSQVSNISTKLQAKGINYEVRRQEVIKLLQLNILNRLRFLKIPFDQIEESYISIINNPKHAFDACIIQYS